MPPEAGHHLSPGDPRPAKARRVGVVTVPASALKKPTSATPDRSDAVSLSLTRTLELSLPFRLMPFDVVSEASRVMYPCYCAQAGEATTGEGGASAEGTNAAEGEEVEGGGEGEDYDVGGKRPRCVPLLICLEACHLVMRDRACKKMKFQVF